MTRHGIGALKNLSFYAMGKIVQRSLQELSLNEKEKKLYVGLGHVADNRELEFLALECLDNKHKPENETNKADQE